MNVILFESVPNLGTIGDKVKVKAGYARNFLIPQGKAAPATEQNLAALELRRAELEQLEAQMRNKAQSRADVINGVNLEIRQLAGEEGKLFGSVGTQDIVDALAALGHVVTRPEVQLPDGVIRQTGDYDLEIRLHAEVRANVKLQVVADSAS